MTETTIFAQDRQTIEKATRVLEQSSFAIRIANQVGKSVDQVVKQLPAPVLAQIETRTTQALEKALSLAMRSLDETKRSDARNRLHMAATAATGGIGGFFGVAGAAADIPVSTIIMLRSIAAIARQEGENLTELEARLECLNVLGLGGGAAPSDSADSSYYTSRIAVARTLSAELIHGVPAMLTQTSERLTLISAEDFAEKGTIQVAAKLAQTETGQQMVQTMTKFLDQTAARYSASVTEKVAAQAVPIAGAVLGAGINVIFMRYYQEIAHSHFALRRLERQYGYDAVHAAYLSYLA